MEETHNPVIPLNLEQERIAFFKITCGSIQKTKKRSLGDYKVPVKTLASTAFRVKAEVLSTRFGQVTGARAYVHWQAPHIQTKLHSPNHKLKQAGSNGVLPVLTTIRWRMESQSFFGRVASSPFGGLRGFPLIRRIQKSSGDTPGRYLSEPDHTMRISLPYSPGILKGTYLRVSRKKP